MDKKYILYEVIFVFGRGVGSTNRQNIRSNFDDATVDTAKHSRWATVTRHTRIVYAKKVYFTQ